jgi:hypothetical protein
MHHTVFGDTNAQHNLGRVADAKIPNRADDCHDAQFFRGMVQDARAACIREGDIFALAGLLHSAFSPDLANPSDVTCE